MASIKCRKCFLHFPYFVADCNSAPEPVYVRAFTNAAFQQRVTLQPETGSPLVYAGSGEGDSSMGYGVISTAGNGSSARGYQVTVSVESFFNGSWQPSSVMQGSTSIMYYNLILVVSEDYMDNDWNHAAVTLTWWDPSQTRSLSDFNVEAKVTGGSPTAATE